MSISTPPVGATISATEFGPHIESATAPDTYYVVPMFPYPSGKLHVGHLRNYAIADAYARHARARGKRVLFPFGWDSFGLPAEKAAQTSGVDPQAWTEANIEQMRAQLADLALSIDWQCELATHTPAFYRHTQALFITLMEHGLVYKKPAEVWWDEVDQTVLANEQVVDGRGWRSGAPAVRRTLAMYWISTSRYAQELAEYPLCWSSGAAADHLAWIGYQANGAAPRLRDWCVSRQRKWGTPVPAIECSQCGAVPMAATQLPHPHAQMGQPCACPKCGEPARKSDETLDTFFDSAWYYLRYPEQAAEQPAQQPFGPQALAWAPVDLYVGGREHATMHLLYARFLSRALADCGLPCPREPFKRYMAQGMIKARAFSVADSAGVRQSIASSRVARDAAGNWVSDDGQAVHDEGVQKMSKSKLNGVEPAEVIAAYGVDALRLCLFFSAPFEFDMEWDERALAGCARFVARFAALAEQLAGDDELAPATPQALAHNAVADQTLLQTQGEFNAYAHEQFERHDGLNSLVAALMKRTTEIERSAASLQARRQAYGETCQALFALAPGLAERSGTKVDPAWSCSWRPERVNKPVRRAAMIALQYGGKLIDALEMPTGITAQDAFERAMAGSVKFAERMSSLGADRKSTVWVDGRVLNVRLAEPIEQTPSIASHSVP